jgi:hypothetical protein
MGWSYGLATNEGAVHQGDGVDCQDAALVDFSAKGALIAAISDGAGSTRHGAEGAQIATRAFCFSAAHLLQRKRVADLDEKSAREIVEDVERHLEQAAAASGIPLAEYSCTLLGVLADENDAVFLQIGDGAAVYHADALQVAFWPEDSEFINVTQFVTGVDAQKQLRFHRVGGPIRHVALFTDGLQYLVLDYKSQAPHGPFFERVFHEVSTSADPSAASAWLENLLKSPHVTSRSDDDTGIVVASSS